MSEEAKSLLMQLKKEKKIDKQIELVKELKAYYQEEIVNNVLSIHLQNKEDDSLRLEIMNVLDFRNPIIIKPLSEILKNPDEPITIKEKAINLLGLSNNKKAMSILLSLYKKSKDKKILENVLYSLTFFNNKDVVKPLIKCLKSNELRLPVLSGLARNDYVVLSSQELIKEISSLNLTNNFENLQVEKITDVIFNEFKYKSREELVAAIQDKSINKKIADYAKKRSEIDKSTKKKS